MVKKTRLFKGVMWEWVKDEIKLGLLEATRFLALKSSAEKYDDSVKWHQEWQAQLDKEAFFDEVFK
jgi:hypothetical protein